MRCPDKSIEEADAVKNLGRSVAIRLGIKKANAFGTVFGATIAALVAAGVVFASITVSNVLTLGPAQLQPTTLPTISTEVVSLVEIETLPSTIVVGEGNEVEFGIEASGPVSNATLWFELNADGVSLNDYTIVEVDYEHPSGGSDTVSLTSSGGVLKGELKSGWSIPADYDETAKMEITFQSDAPIASYYVDLWVEGTVGGVSNTPPSSTQHIVDATDGEDFTPEFLNVNVGDVVQWANVGNKPHTITFSDSAIPDEDFLGDGQDFFVTFSQAGTFNYVCIFHDGMTGVITVQ